MMGPYWIEKRDANGQPWHRVNHPELSTPWEAAALALEWSRAVEDDVWPTGEHASYRVQAFHGGVIAEYVGIHPNPEPEESRQP